MIDCMTLSEIAVMREALVDKHRAESGKGPIASGREQANYIGWRKGLSPLEVLDHAIAGTL